MASSPTLHIDFETRSALDLKECGLWNYARHPTTDVRCMAWAFGDEEPQIWVPSWQYDRCIPPSLGIMCDIPDRVVSHIADGGKVVAHNAPFELAIWNSVLAEKYGIIFPLTPEQTFCTMAQCYSMALPGALEDAALALGLSVLKDAEGRALMLRMARPRKANDDGTYVWWDEPEKLARLYAYCRQDVRVERELEKRLMPLSERERKVWLMDYRINQRGVAVDTSTAAAAVKMVDKLKEAAGPKLAAITGGAVQSVSALAAMKDWMSTRGVAVDSLAKQALTDLLTTELPSDVRQALIIRQEVGKASLAKLDKLLSFVGSDGRLHYMYQYHGAGTGRFTGRGVQTSNLVRDMPSTRAVERILEFVRTGDHDAIDMIYGAPMTAISRCMRSFFVAPEGKLLICGDWNNIEGRGQAWFAGEQWKLDAFIAADNKTGPGIYELAYSTMFGVPVESVKDPSEERQVGKVSELAFGYQGGKDSFHTMGKNYGVKVSDEKANEFKEAWRKAHPKVVNVWYEIQRAAIAAVRNPGQAYSCGHTGRQAKYKMAGSFLWCLLPSGRVICYPYPKIIENEYGPALTYMAVPDPNKPEKIIHDPRNASNWARIGTYGGSLFNNIVQGFCRDFLVDGMLALDDRGACIVMHTYDDIAIEVDEAKAPAACDFVRDLMRTPPAWAAGFPLMAKPKVMKRYGK